MKNSYEITSAIFPITEGYIIPTISVVKRNYENEFFIRMVIKKCNKLKVDIKTSYCQSINEVKWKNPTIANVKK